MNPGKIFSTLVKPEDHIKGVHLRKSQPIKCIDVFPRIVERKKIPFVLVDQIGVPHEVGVELLARLGDFLEAASERDIVSSRGMLPEEAHSFIEPDGVHKETWIYSHALASPAEESLVDQVIENHSQDFWREGGSGSDYEGAFSSFSFWHRDL